LGDVVAIAAGQCGGQRDAGALGQDVVLGAWAGAVDRARAASGGPDVGEVDHRRDRSQLARFRTGHCGCRAGCGRAGEGSARSWVAGVRCAATARPGGSIASVHTGGHITDHRCQELQERPDRCGDRGEPPRLGHASTHVLRVLHLIDAERRPAPDNPGGGLPRTSTRPGDRLTHHHCGRAVDATGSTATAVATSTPADAAARGLDGWMGRSRRTCPGDNTKTTPLR